MSDLNRSVGNQNRYSFWCDHHQQRRMYGVCLWLKDAYDNGRIKAEDPHQDCAQAMCAGNCNAVKMREEELAACKSLYFQEAQIRTERILAPGAESSEGFKRGWDHAGRVLGDTEPTPVKVTQRPVVAKATPKDEGLMIPTMNVAALITQEAKKSVTADEIIKLKREIVAVAKTDPARARELLAKVKKLEAA